MVSILRSISALALILLSGLPLSGRGQEEPRQIKVMSYNIRQGLADDGPNSWQYRAPASAMMLLDCNPDVIGLQEVRTFQADYLIQCCPGYRYVGVGRDNGRKEGEMVPIFYNKKKVSLKKSGTFWLSETPDKPSKGWDGACKRIATWAVFKHKESGCKFLFVNTHLDHKGKEAQAKGAALLLERIAQINKDGLPVVLTGDFNLTEDQEPMLRIGEQLRNARQRAAVSDNKGTFHGWGKKSKIIDHIFYSGFSSCILYRTEDKEYLERTFISDHFPISAQLVF